MSASVSYAADADADGDADDDAEADSDGLDDPDHESLDTRAEGDGATPCQAFFADPTEAASNPDAATLAVLVQRVMNQDQAALTDLYRRLATRVFRRASQLVRDISTSEEVVEDVFWQVWRQAPRFDASRGTVTAWVMQITQSRALDALRARRRHPLFMALDIDSEVHQRVSETADPPTQLEQMRLAEQVRWALELLDPLRRQLVSLAFERGYSQAEIADHTGLPLGTVKSHIRRALITMKASLESHMGPAPEHAA